MSKALRLITNIAAVNVVTTITNRIDCFALLFEEHPEERRSLSGQYAIRGFLTDGSLPTFTIRPDINPTTIPFQPMESSAKMLVDSGIRPLSVGVRLVFPNFKLDIFKSKHEMDFDVQDFDDILEVWEELRYKTADYWKHPAMPIAHYERAENVRNRLNLRKEMLG